MKKAFLRLLQLYISHWIMGDGGREVEDGGREVEVQWFDVE
jgi:hypothetical protein